MEDQGKRLMLAVAVAFGIMMVWTLLFPPAKQEPKKTDEAAQSADSGKSDGSAAKNDGSKPASADGTTPSAANGTSAEPAEVAETETPRGKEVFFDFDFSEVHARFSSYGGSLVSWQLKGERLEDRKRHAPEELIRVADDAYETLRVSFPDSTFELPAKSEWVGEKKSDTELVFTWSSKDLQVVKTITIHPDDYLLEMNVSVELIGAQSAKQSLAVSLFGQEAIKGATKSRFSRVSRFWKSACYYDDDIHTWQSKTLANDGKAERTGQINWGGFDHAYFLVAGAIEGGSDQRSQCELYPLAGVDGGMGVDLVQSPVELKKGEPGIKSKIAFYLGPKYMDRLEEADHIVGFKTHYRGSVNLGWLAILAGPLLSLLKFFQGFVVNWGIAILLLTFVVKGLTLPWTHKSMKSMKAMAKLKPQLEKIKEKYADDRQRQNVETMNLFKAHKVNPMSGCLPMLLQMPIWFALYRSLTVAAELYQAPFISGWIDDLTLPDPYHVMPVLLTGMMFLQTRLTPSTGSGAQQKMLMYGMPIMFGFFSFFFPAGLTLYIFTNTCFTAAHHLYMNKDEHRGGAAVEVAETAAAVIDVEPVDEAPAASSSQQATSSSKKKSGKGKKKRKR